MSATDRVMQQILDETKRQNTLLQEVLTELEWGTKKLLPDLDLQRRALGTVTLQPREKHIIYQQEDRTGEVFFSFITTVSTGLSVILTVDGDTPVAFPTVGAVYTAGDTAPNNVLWATFSGGIYALYSNFVQPFDKKITIECVNLGTSAATLLESVVLGRLRR